MRMRPLKARVCAHQTTLSHAWLPATVPGGDITLSSHLLLFLFLRLPLSSPLFTTANTRAETLVSVRSWVPVLLGRVAWAHTNKGKFVTFSKKPADILSHLTFPKKVRQHFFFHILGMKNSFSPGTSTVVEHFIRCCQRACWCLKCETCETLFVKMCDWGFSSLCAVMLEDNKNRISLPLTGSFFDAQPWVYLSVISVFSFTHSITQFISSVVCSSVSAASLLLFVYLPSSCHPYHHAVLSPASSQAGIQSGDYMIKYLSFSFPGSPGLHNHSLFSFDIHHATLCLLPLY